MDGKFLQNNNNKETAGARKIGLQLRAFTLLRDPVTSSALQEYNKIFMAWVQKNTYYNFFKVKLQTWMI